jgi:ribose transport system permease protein
VNISEGLSKQFLSLGTSKFLGVPLSVYAMLAIALGIWIFLDFRPAGRYLYAVGSNPNAAKLAGVNVNRLTSLSLIIGAALAGFAGLILASVLGVGSPDSGPPYLLPAFTAVFLGATQIKKGRPNVFGTLIAVYLLAIGIKGLQLTGQPSYIGNLFNGLALIVAVALAVRSYSAARRGD